MSEAQGNHVTRRDVLSTAAVAVAGAAATAAPLAEAIAAQEKATAASKNPRQIFNLAILYQKYGDIDNAVRLYRQILKNRPKYPNARYYLVLNLFDQKRYEEAITAARAGTQLEVENPMYHYYMGRGFFALGRLDEAASALRESRRLGPGPQVRKEIDAILERISERTQ